MNASDTPSEFLAYRCPGEQHPISRAVHLGRLAAFYPACRQCPHRDDTGSLSPRQVEQLAETSERGQPRALFHDEGAGGVYLNELTPALTRDMAAAFGLVMKEGREEREETRGKTEEGMQDEKPRDPPSPLPFPPSSNPQSPIPNPSIILAGDGRPITAELTAAAGEGLRWSGCDVVDIGPATAACLAFAVHHLGKMGTGTSPDVKLPRTNRPDSEPVPVFPPADGGILVGNPGEEPHRVGLQFWDAGPRPLSAGGSLEPLIERYRAGVSRPARSFGALHRFQADVHYLAALAEHYHALRPLRVVVDSASKPLVEYLTKLTATVACQIIPCRATRHDLPEQVCAEAAHFAVCVDGDGETCRVFDEKGQAVSTERLLLLLAPDVGSVVLEGATPRAVIERLEQKGVRVVMIAPRRADMAAALQEHGAQFGGGPSGRFWHRVAGVPLPDALMTITRLLALLSQSDQPFSAILDCLLAAG